MLEKQFDQTELARRAAQFMPRKVFGRDNVSKYLKGVTLPTPLYLSALARALGVQPEELLPSTTIRLATNMEDNPRLALRAIDENTAFLRINQEVPMAVALEILTLLRRQDGAET